jgi:small neutral amino acid transporter SnatA (MarC family)
LTTVLLMSSVARVVFAFTTTLIVLGLTLVSLLYASPILQFLGETGTNVSSRVFGLIFLTLAVQFILDGMHASFHP